jgi:hypothetical protein
MTDDNNNFGGLTNLLRLKRHEIPPPGYFDRLSGDVMTRIRAGETGGKVSFLERLKSGSGIFDGLMQSIAARPGIVGALATAMCALFLAGVVALDRSESGGSVADPMTAQVAPTAPDASPDLAAAETLGAPLGGLVSSTNPVSSLQPVSTLFGPSENPLFQPV